MLHGREDHTRPVTCLDLRLDFRFTKAVEKGGASEPVVLFLVEITLEKILWELVGVALVVPFRAV